MNDIDIIRNVLDRCNMRLTALGNNDNGFILEAYKALARIENPNSVIRHVCKKAALPDWVDDPVEDKVMAMAHDITSSKDYNELADEFYKNNQHIWDQSNNAWGHMRHMIPTEEQQQTAEGNIDLSEKMKTNIKQYLCYLVEWSTIEPETSYDLTISRINFSANGEDFGVEAASFVERPEVKNDE